jgi:hypothetical protein
VTTVNSITVCAICQCHSLSHDIADHEDTGHTQFSKIELDTYGKMIGLDAREDLGWQEKN